MISYNFFFNFVKRSPWYEKTKNVSQNLFIIFHILCHNLLLYLHTQTQK